MSDREQADNPPETEALYSLIGLAPRDRNSPANEQSRERIARRAGP